MQRTTSNSSGFTLTSTPPKVARKSKLWRSVDTVASVILALSGLFLPFALTPGKFSSQGTYLYVLFGFLIIGLYLFLANVLFLYARCSRKFRKRSDSRQRLTLGLRRLRGLAVGGGVALLASVVAIVQDDVLHVLTLWLVLTLLLHLVGYLLTDSTFAPEDVVPISDREILDAVVAMDVAAKSSTN